MNPLASAFALFLLFFQPATLVSAASSSVTIAPAGEPGEPFEVSGVVYESDGRTPASGVRVHAYHTDARGFYSDNQDRQRSRLAGTAVTGRDGSYRFRSIWPGHYPGGQTPRHVHFELTAPDGRRASDELQFSNDPVLPASERERAQAAAARGDRFHRVQNAVKGKDGVRRSTFDLRLPERARRAS